MKLWYRFVCAFVAVAVVLFFVRVPDVDAEVFIFCDVPESAYNDMSPDFINYIDNINVTDDMINFYNDWKEFSFDSDEVDLFAVFFTSNEIVTITHGYSDDFYYVDRDISAYGSDYNNNIINYFCYGDTNVTRYTKDYKYIQGKIILNGRLISIDFNNNRFSWDNDSDYTGNFVSCYVYPFNYDSSSLTFTIDPELSDSMDMINLNTNFTIEVLNETNNYYNYVFYISSSPASSGVQKSFSDAVYIMSSNQWCMKYSWSSLMPDDDVSISEWVKDVFGRVIDPWGNIFNPEQSYMGRHGSGSSDDGIYYYTLSQQKKCPFYLIKPNDSRAHVIPYSALNLSLDTTYYANIIYLDTTDYGVVPSSNSWGAADTSHNNYRSHPLYNLNLISRFAVYSSTEFSVTSGNFTKDDDGLYDYKDVVDNSNPASSSATISSEDNSVSINNANSYDNSSSVSYINYGTIYHNCSWSGSGGSSSGARPSVPDLPDAEFNDLYDQSGNFFDFVADVLDSVGAVPMLFITAAFAILLFLRIWGR